MLRIVVFSILFIVCFFSCDRSVDRHNSQGWELVYKNDRNGNALKENKKQLIDAVRNGYPIRVGFGGRRPSDALKSVEHVVEAHFLTVANGEEVFAQIIPIIGQNPDLDSDTLSINFREELKWTIMVGTNGLTDRLTFNRVKDSIVGHNSNRRSEISWFVQYPNNKTSQIPQELWEISFNQ